MKLITISIPESTAYIIPIGDLHRGDQHFGKVGKQKLQGYLDWVKEHANSRIFLMGDILNVAGRGTKTSPFESLSGDDEYHASVELFKPVASQIVGVITGNHENRMSDMFGFNPLIPFASELGIPYLGYSAVLKIRVGQRPDDPTRYNQLYHGYAHHTTGGGGTIGNSLNRKTKLQDIVQGMDFYMGGHSHQLVTGFRTVFEPGQNQMIERKVAYVDTGSFLDWNGSYAEKAMMVPGKLGSPRIRLSGQQRHHDVHVSL